MAEITVREALPQAMQQEMRNDKNVFVPAFNLTGALKLFW